MPDTTLSNPVSRHIWETKYRYTEADRVPERSIEDTWRRVAP